MVTQQTEGVSRAEGVIAAFTFRWCYDLRNDLCVFYTEKPQKCPVCLYSTLAIPDNPKSLLTVELDSLWLQEI